MRLPTYQEETAHFAVLPIVNNIWYNELRLINITAKESEEKSIYQPDEFSLNYADPSAS